MGIVKKSFYCGLIIFLISFLGLLFKLDLSIVLFFLLFFPGIMYGIVLVSFLNLSFKVLFFVLLSSGLHYFACNIADNLDELINIQGVNFFVASILGSMCLFMLYYFICDKELSFHKGMLFALMSGITGVFHMFFVNPFILSSKDSAVERILEWPLTFLIFPIWQTGFGYAIYLAKKSHTKKNNPINKI